MQSKLLLVPSNLFPFCASSLSCHPDPNGHVYQSVVSVRGLGADEGAQALPLPRSLLLGLPVGEGLLEAASALVLDEAHVAVVGVPHPSAGAGKGTYSIITPSQIKSTSALLRHICLRFSHVLALAGFHSTKSTILSMA